MSNVTMETITVDFKAIKEKFLCMDTPTKRTHYACKDKFVVLDSITTWQEYVIDNSLNSKILLKEDENIFSIDDEINTKISLWKGDITRLEVDAIVNAANSSLLGGGGVDGAIHKAAGPNLLKECRFLNGCKEGCTKISGGYNLPSKYVIHAVGPQGEKPSILKSVYESCLKQMLKNQIRSIAIPCISTGIYGYPPEHAVHEAALSVREFLEHHKSEVDRVIFVVFLDSDKKIYEEELPKYFPTKQSNCTDSSNL